MNEGDSPVDRLPDQEAARQMLQRALEPGSPLDSLLADELPDQRGWQSTGRTEYAYSNMK